MGARDGRRLLLAVKALSCGTMLVACKAAEPLPGNPKGSWYEQPPDAGADASAAEADAGAQGSEAGGGAAPSASPTETTAPTQVPTTTPEPPPLPANPKGSWYDDGGYAPDPDAPPRKAGA